MGRPFFLDVPMQILFITGKAMRAEMFPKKEI
jgi:hypothetical protein